MEDIIKFFKHVFIPHEHNNYKPHILREASVVTIAVISIALLLTSLSTTSYINNNNLTATVLPAVLVDLANDVRSTNKESNLTRNPVLDEIAKQKAEDMARLGYFAHTSPEGLTPWYWFNKVGYNFAYAGENLAINFTESADVENAWLNSPTHKANILNSHFTEIGIATVDAIYQGHLTTYVVQSFGTPALAKKIQSGEQVATSISKPILNTKLDTKNEVEKSLPTLLALAPDVKGESISEEPEPQKLETITDTKEFVAVKNTSVTTNAKEAMVPESTHYSTWKERLMFKIPSYTDLIYHILILIVFVSVLIMAIVEIKIQHPKNIMYGVLLLTIMTCFVYLNGSSFLIGLFS